MKTIKLTTHWTTEQADDIYVLLDVLKEAIWQSYGKDIVNMHQEITKNQEAAAQSSEFNDKLPF